jgi:putative SOS response-associated peptidase YedK
MQNVYSIATKPSYFQDLLNDPDVDYNTCYQARPGMVLPILLNDGKKNRLELATWGLKLRGKRGVHPQVHMRQTLKERPFNQYVRRQRCAVPANCYIVAKNGVRLVRLLKQRVFCLGGIYQVHEERGRKEIRFAILQTEPADMLCSYCDEMPVAFAVDRWQRWATSKYLGDVMHRADRSTTLWYDHFRVSEKILQTDQNSRELLVPLGATAQQLEDRKHALSSIQINELRANSGGKHG